MNVSYEWLRAFVPFDESPAQLRDLITAHITPVDELVALRDDLAAIVIARVVEEAPHPDSDHLHVTKVDAGTGTLLDVVCGAPNVTAGKMYPFAMTGTVLPNGLKIQKRKIRGAISDGMLCSAREIGLGQEQDGIMELDVDVAPGTPLLRALPLGDTRLVVDVGANRPDLLSHLGMARDIAAITTKPFALPRIDGLGADVPVALTHATTGRAGSRGTRNVRI
jgi:phenylalanyl-tRNA synthetase beta chain